MITPTCSDTIVPYLGGAFPFKITLITISVAFESTINT